MVIYRIKDVKRSFLLNNFNMYYFQVLFGVIVSLTLSQALQMNDPKIKEFVEGCAKENGVDLMSVIAGPKPEAGHFQKKEFKCMSKCLAVKMEIFNEAGDCNVDKVKEKLGISDEDKIKGIADKCAGENNQDDICEKIHGRQWCLLKNIM